MVAALYHLPKALYKLEELLDYIEGCVDEIHVKFPKANVVVLGYLTQLPYLNIVERTGLTQIDYQPTRGDKILDRIYTSGPLYNTVRVGAAMGKSDHKAIVAYIEKQPGSKVKTTTQRMFCKILKFTATI